MRRHLKEKGDRWCNVYFVALRGPRRPRAALRPREPRRLGDVEYVVMLDLLRERRDRFLDLQYMVGVFFSAHLSVYSCNHM